MSTVYLTPDNDQQWLDWRKQDLTSTEVSALFHMSPYSTLFELWHRKHNPDSADALQDNDRMQAGRHIEPAIASLVSERYGVTVEPWKVYARDIPARLGASFDFRVTGVTAEPVADESLRELFAKHGPGIIECKNVDGLVFKRTWTDDETPAHIELQLQHQMELTDTAWGAVAALVGGNRLEMFARMRDPRVGVAIRQAAAKFWDSVDWGNAPDPVMPDDADVLIALNQFADGSTVDLSDDGSVNALLTEYAALGEAIKTADERRKVIKATVLEIAGPASKALWSSGSLSLAQVADNPGKLVTPEMVGTYVGARSGHRRFQVYVKQSKEE